MMIKYRDFETNYSILDINNIDLKKLKPMRKCNIICGKKYGLPFDYLMTDVMSGCVSLRSTCYGNCTAALYWIDRGYDFGKPTINIFDSTLFEKSVTDLPVNQKWLRQGWMSDCSLTDESWNLVANVSDILKKYDISLLIITKVHRYPSIDIMKKLAENNVEIRVSLSALDSEREIKKRFKFLLEYKDIGGISIPYLMTAKYKNKILIDNQNYIIKFVIDNDFIAGEHPLRISVSNSLFKELSEDGFYHPKYKNQYWIGRILYNIDNFILPAPTHLKPNYSLKYRSFSSIPKDKKIIGVCKNLPTYNDLKNNKYTKEMFDHATYSMQKN